ncbi:SUR7/PalI family-domain-containing protein [Rhexocercosporidium sp. MPI-PUGE-AT-0058]|nr:SUR7/PalI family-domain-containing protein [Rhexocercosporidium sp. MPI-PUGE-AT-0058]
MLRPATPLTILLFAAFFLLLISVLSTPIIKQIPLGSFEGVDFGVFGYCKGSNCTSIEIGYNTRTVYSKEQTDTFDLSTETRATLSAILVVHPIAALFTLVMAVMAAAAHFHAPSHSPRYLLGIFILSILTLITSLLSFLIDVLLFVPHMAWGSYIVLAATILIAASGIVSCAMRRTLVSRKARKRRIAENAEMNGENFYNRQGPVPAPLAASTTLIGSESAVDKLPAFATFEMAKKDPERTSDERIPLTTRTPTENSPNGNGAAGTGVDRYGGPQRMGEAPQRDQYGNIIPRPGGYGGRSRDPSADPSLNRQYSENSMNSRGRGMPGGYRGGPRGGGYSNGRGGPSRGGYGPPRGGYGGPYRDQMGPPGGAMMRGGRGGAPPAYGRGGYDNRGPSPAGYGQRRPQPGGYDQYPPPQQAEYAAYNPDDSRSSLPRAESPPPLPGLDTVGPVGQAIEMDATTGSPSTAPRGFGQFGNIRESDGDVAGMVGLQQQRLQQRQTVDSDGSRYSSEDAYVPPRQAWGEGGRSSPLNPNAQPAELPSPTTQVHRRISSAGDNYYEDVDPRFVTEEQAMAPPAAGLSSGYPPRNPSNQNLRPIQPVSNLDGSNSYEDLQSGSRSPAESDRSNFTSVSQRGVNPRWNGGPGYAPMPTRRPAPQQNDILLNSNPDFQLPGGRGRGGYPRGGRPNPGPGMVPNSAYPPASGL